MQTFEFNQENERALLAWLRKWRTVYTLLLLSLVGAFAPIYTMEQYKQHVVEVTEETPVTLKEDFKSKIQLYAKDVGEHHPIITWVTIRSAPVMLFSFLLLIGCVVYSNLLWRCPCCHQSLGNSHLSGVGFSRAYMSESFAKKCRKCQFPLRHKKSDWNRPVGI